MQIIMKKNDIVSSSELVKNFSKFRDEVKKKSKMIVFKNNKPDMVLVDFDEYEKLLTNLEILEDISIMKSIEERERNDNGVRHSINDLELLAKDLLSR
ncbi:type II toxin-antitoxin system Phd/YefM family antitoxin [Cetobacterium sp.]|uniref:type II toxin-antitoxin system Phd/YefM family antitoxin n=1 Tax=Cetobacterium sp. TaxID=2071632 RepID=UPI003F3C4EFA